MKSIADFKRAMKPGTFWSCTHQYIGAHPSAPKELGTRECLVSNTVSFGFRTVSDSVSFSNWPKKAEFSVEGDTVVITKAGFCTLRYTQENK